MTREEKERRKQLLLKDLCARLPYGLKVCYINLSDEMPKVWDLIGMPAPHLADILVEGSHRFAAVNIEENIRPYLRPMSSMTEKEAKEIAILHGVKNILSIKITDEYINITVDDGFSSIDTITIWYDEIVSSIESFDWLNKKMFDYRGLISIGLALEAPKNMYKTKTE